MNHCFFKWFFLLFIISCTYDKNNSKSANKTEPYNPSIGIKNRKIKFTLNPTFEKPYVFQIKRSTQITQEIDKEQTESVHRTELSLAYVFNKDTSNSIIAYIKFLGFKTYVKSAEEETEIDAATAGESYLPAKKIFAAFQNSTLRVIIDSVGGIKSITGQQGIRSKMFQLADGDENAIQTINNSLKEYLDESYLKQLMEQGLKYFTTNTLIVGDRIEKVDSIKTDVPIIVKSIYKLVSADNNIATTEISGDINIENQQLAYMNTYASFSLKGEQTGSIKIDIPSGMLVSSSSELNLNGKVSVKSTDVPIEIKIRNTIELRK